MSMFKLAESVKNGYRLKIYQDNEPMNPRTEWDNLGTIAYGHSKYILGEEEAQYTEQYDNWDQWFNCEILKPYSGNVFYLPVYIYDHSGVTISTKPFHCPWDSGQIGFIYVTKEKVRKWFGVKRITAKIRDKVYQALQHEINIYDKYLTGQAWGYILEKAVDCKCKGSMNPCCYEYIYETIDSCWSYYGDFDLLRNELPVDKKTINKLLDDVA